MSTFIVYIHTGISVKSITFKSKDSVGNNIYTITLTNNATQDIIVPIGPQGIQGPKGEKGDTTAVSVKWVDLLNVPTIFPTNWANVADKPTTFNDTTAVKLTGSTMTGDLKGTAAKSISGFGKVYNPVWG